MAWAPPWWSLGIQEQDTSRLKEAITAYQFALEVRTRNLVPIDWAWTQRGLGFAVFTFGQHGGGIERIKEAVVAFQLALQEFSQEWLPVERAITQGNLDTALQALAERGVLTTFLLEKAGSLLPAAGGGKSSPNQHPASFEPNGGKTEGIQHQSGNLQ
jgi:hypothetical protein